MSDDQENTTQDHMPEEPKRVPGARFGESGRFPNLPSDENQDPGATSSPIPDGGKTSELKTSKDSGIAPEAQRMEYAPVPPGARFAGSSGKTLRTVGRGRELAVEVQRTKTLVMRPSRTPSALTKPAPTEETPCRNKLLLYLLDDLDAKDRSSIDTLRGNDDTVEIEFDLIRRHLEMHRAQDPVALRRGSLLRLAKVMRKEGYLAWSYPGNRALWRRALVGSVLLWVLCATLFLWLDGPSMAERSIENLLGSVSTVDENGAVTTAPEPVAVGDQVFSGANERYLWLATQRVGVSTIVRIDRSAQCTIAGQRKLILEEGTLLSVDVSADAGFSGPFEIETIHGQAMCGDGFFSARKSGDQFEVNVGRGEVILRDPVRGNRILVPAGMGCRLTAGRSDPELFPLVEVRVERKIGEGKQIRVRLVNRSMHRVQAEYPRESDSPYTIKLTQDRSLRATSPKATSTELLRSYLVSSTSLPSRSTLTLQSATSGGESQLPIDIDLVAILGDHEWTDYTCIVGYRGKLMMESLGELVLSPTSKTSRLNFKDETPQ